MTSHRSARRSVLRQRDFLLFFAGTMISSSGTWLQNVAQGVLVLELTRRSLVVGLTQAATFVPVMLLALHGGRLADRFDRRRLLILTQVVAAAATTVLAALAAAGRAGVPSIVAVAVVLGMQFAVAIPTSMALIPRLVPRQDLGSAMGLMSVTYNVARAAGPVLATVAISLAGYAFAFGVNALTFLVLAVAVAAIRPARDPAPPEGGTVAEAVRYAWTDRRIRARLAVVAAVSLAIDPVYTVSPALARDVFGRPAADAGLLVSAFGAGAVVAALALGGLLRSRTIRARSVGLASLSATGTGLVLLAAAPSFAAAVAGLVLAGMGYLVTITTWTTEIQRDVPEAYRGRVMALWTLAFLGTRPVAALLDGGLADLLGARGATATMVAPVVVALAALVAGRRRDRAPAAAAGEIEGGPVP